MSGGHFSTSPWGIMNLMEEIGCILNNKSEYPEFTDEVWKRFEIAEKQLQKAYDMVHSIDYLMQGDYGVESFLKACKEKIGE